MKTEIISIFVLMLLIITGTLVVGTSNTIQKKSTENKTIINLKEYIKENSLITSPGNDWTISYQRRYDNWDACNLPATDDCAFACRNRLNAKGWDNDGRFYNHDTDKAWHWQYGNENTYVDCSDLAIYIGHGGDGRDPVNEQRLAGLILNKTQDDRHVSPGEQTPGHGNSADGFGRHDTEFIAFQACFCLNDTSVRRWDDTMNKLRILLGFKTTSKGGMMSYEWIYRCTKDNPKRVVWSWFKACTLTQVRGVAARAMVESPYHWSNYITQTGGGEQIDDIQHWKTHYFGDLTFDVPSINKPFADSMTVYKVIPKDANETLMELRDIFGISSPIEVDEGNFYMQEGNIYLEVNQIEGVDYGDDTKLWIYHEDPPELPSLDMAMEIAENFIVSKGLLPEDDEILTDTFYSDFQGGEEDEEDNIIEEFPTAIWAGFERKLDGYPVMGTGSRCFVFVTEGDEIPSFTKIWRKVKPDGSVEIFSPTTAENFFNEYGSKVTMGDIPIFDEYEINTTVLGYYEEGYGIEQKYLIPVYLFITNITYNDNVQTDIPIYIPASESFLKPIAEITNPDDSYTVPEGTPIWFNGMASYGTPPYTYKWYSNFNGYLGEGSGINVSGLSVNIIDGEVIPHTITLKVTDNNVQVGEDVISVTVTSDNDAPDKPVISGPKTGTAGVEYSYTIVSTDPDGDNINYYVYLTDVDDGEYEGWFGEYVSGTELTIKYTWENEGTFFISAKANDTNGAESEWSDPLEVTMPRDKSIQNTMFQWFLEQFPILQWLFQRLI